VQLQQGSPKPGLQFQGRHAHYRGIAFLGSKSREVTDRQSSAQQNRAPFSGR
jgi:hypothetical protein